MHYTLGEAAKATGKTKTTIAKAIGKGRLSASKDFGRYQIDPAELSRVYPLKGLKTEKVDDARLPQDPELLAKIAGLEAALEGMQKLNRQLEAERDRAIADKETELARMHAHLTTITALLSSTPKQDPAPKPQGGLLARLFRRETAT